MNPAAFSGRMHATAQGMPQNLVLLNSKMTYPMQTNKIIHGLWDTHGGI